MLDDDTARWHVDNVCWLLRTLARTPMMRERRLILPGRGYYRFGKAQSHDLALLIFEQTRAFAGVADRPLTLKADEPADEDQFGYPSGMENDPFVLIAILVRDLAYRFLCSLGETPVCEDTEWDHLVDVVGCLMGFGVFLANDAVTIVTVRQGSKTHIGEYRTDLRGRLSERELVFELAIFLTIHDLPPDDALRFLEPHMTGHLKTAMKDVEAYKDELKLAWDGY